MKKDITYICHIIESIELIESYTKEGKEVFEKDHKTYDAVLRQLQIMSESTQKLNKAVKEKYSHIPWSEISGFRNKLTHDYLQGIDTNIIWETITNNLPSLKEAMEEELQNHQK